MATVKLSDIAHKLGTSIVTVSNALNGKGGLSLELREKIIKTAQEMGYQRHRSNNTKSKISHHPLSKSATASATIALADPLGDLAKANAPHPPSNAQPADSLSASTTGQILTTPDPQLSTKQIGILVAERYFSIGNSFYWDLYQLTATTAAAMGIASTMLLLKDEQIATRQLPHLLTLQQEQAAFTPVAPLTNAVALASPDYSAEAKTDITAAIPNKAFQLNGLIIMGPIEHQYLQLLARLPIPCTLLDYYDADLDLPAVLPHNYINAYHLTRYVIRKGHTRLGFIGNRLGFTNIADRFYGFCRALLMSNIALNESWFIDDRNLQNGKFYEQTPLPTDFVPLTPDETKSKGISTPIAPSRVPLTMPTAFVCNCDSAAEILQRTLVTRGFKVPEEISIVGNDNFLKGSSYTRELTTIDVQPKLMAQYAVRNIVQLMNGEDLITKIHRLEGQLIERHSVCSITK